MPDMYTHNFQLLAHKPQFAHVLVLTQILDSVSICIAMLAQSYSSEHVQKATVWPCGFMVVCSHLGMSTMPYKSQHLVAEKAQVASF